MDANDEMANVFVTPDFWKSSSLMTESVSSLHHHNPLFSLELSKKTKPRHSMRRERELPADGFFKLPPLVKDVILDYSQDIPDFEVDVLAQEDSLDSGDVWLSCDPEPEKEPQHQTWDTFDRPEQIQPPVFMTEAGPSAFDALFETEENYLNMPSGKKCLVVDQGSYHASLLALAMGRVSRLFTWHAEKRSFVQEGFPNPIRVSGYSYESLQGINRMCLECANSTKLLRAFVDKAFASSSTASCPCRVALAGAVDKILLAVQSDLGVRGQRVRSILQLQCIVQPVLSILEYFHGLVQRLRHAKTDERILSVLFHEAQAMEYRDGLLRDLVHETLQMVSKPWTDFVEEWIGVKKEGGIAITKKGPGKSFVKVSSQVWIDDQGFELEEPDFFLDEDRMPSFMPEDTAQTIFETGRSLRFLRTSHPCHLLADTRLVKTARPPSFRWQFDWESITELDEKVKGYEAAVLQALEEVRDNPGQTASVPPIGDIGAASSSRYEAQFFGQDEARIQANMMASMQHLDLAPKPPPQDKLTELLRDGLYRTVDKVTGDGVRNNGTDFSPHWSLVPLLSFDPLVAVQARLVNRECMRLLFSHHKFRDHLDLLKQYHLLGNGVFGSLLSHALFDPELDTAERQAGVALSGGNMGLRLTGREKWPPASSDLCLVLMGLLEDSYQPRHCASAPTQANAAARQMRLPGDISFALRQLSPEEIDRCMDPDSIEALDFLRLTYKPPATLQAIMTPSVLLKYDRLFGLLLRVLRMLFVVKQLSREQVRPSRRRHATDHDNEDGAHAQVTRRFAAEALHFVNQVAVYFFDTGIAQPWQRFERWLDRLEIGPDDGIGDEHDGGEGVVGPDRLRDRHELVLDDIMRTLLLRKRQGPVLELLEQIFGLILRFDKVARSRRGRGADENVGAQTETVIEEGTPQALYASFRKKVEVFITVCKGLGEKGRGRREDHDGANHIEQLVLMLDMNGYYGKR